MVKVQVLLFSAEYAAAFIAGPYFQLHLGGDHSGKGYVDHTPEKPLFDWV